MSVFRIPVSILPPSFQHVRFLGVEEGDGVMISVFFGVDVIKCVGVMLGTGARVSEVISTG